MPAGLPHMNTPQTNAWLKWNSILWLAAMVAPGGLSFAFAATKFPWPLLFPLLLLGPMLASNRMLSQAASSAAAPSQPQ